ncbi:MAG TPA: TonB-dependent receptor, partial [Rhodanobacteraceae bacterium]|nr:TonB-dependent receptor [Rhodanobacteraceae bacterium]
MAYVFAGPSGYFSSATDYYKCEKYEPTTPLPDCTWNPVQYEGTQEGNANLKSITAKSWGYGVVWSPTNNLTLKADYYNVKISNEVSPLSVNTLLIDEAQCRLGQLDAGSGTCIDALQRVQRTPVNSNPQFSENITGITVGPINVSNESIDGIIAAGDWRLDAGRWGDFIFGARYNVTLDHHYQQYPGDPNHDLLREPQFSSEFKTVANASVTWNVGNWSTTLQAQRYGASPNYAAQVYGWEGGSGPYAVASTVGPWITYNGSVAYDWAPGVTTRLIVQNITDKMPPSDKTWAGWPYYNQFNYDPWGRIIWAEIDIHFGKK